MADIVSDKLRIQRVKYLPINKEEYTRVVIRRKRLWVDAIAQINLLSSPVYTYGTGLRNPDWNADWKRLHVGGEAGLGKHV